MRPNRRPAPSPTPTALFGVVSTFLVDRANKTVILRLALSGTESTWANSAGGDWETAANWTPASPAGTAESRARFWGAIAAPATVSLATATCIGGVSFNNSQMYIAAGTGVLSVGDQRRRLSDRRRGQPCARSAAGAACPDHDERPALANAGPQRLSPARAASSKATPPVSLTNANSFAGGVQVNAGTLPIACLMRSAPAR